MTKKHNAHDSGYKKLFSNSELVRQLLTSFVDEEWVNKIGYNTLERIDKPIMLYSGEKRWTAPEELSTLTQNSISIEYIPEFRYYKRDKFRTLFSSC